MKKSHGSRPEVPETCRVSENFDPNLSSTTPRRKPISSPVIKSAKPKKSAPKTPIRTYPSHPTTQGKRSAIAQKNNRSGKKGLDTKEHQQVSCSTPRQPKKAFLLNEKGVGAMAVGDRSPSKSHESKEGVENDPIASPAETSDVSGQTGCSTVENSASPDLEGSSKVRKMKRMILEEARRSIPDAGSGRVMHLVDAFERLLTIPMQSEARRVGEIKKGVMGWVLPGLEQPQKAVEIEEFPSSNVSSAGFSPSEDLETDSRVCSSKDSNDERLSWGSGSSDGGRRSRRNSSNSSERSWNRKLKVTSQQPFKLRTEQRGRLKEEHLLKKVKQMLLKEEKQRIPIAQGLPWTTDKPECLVKPHVKESTEPIDLVLHSDSRAVERAEFDHNVACRLSLFEQMKLERKQQQMLDEEQEIKKLRKELIPKAQPMPCFDQPFIPQNSTRPQTVPKEPNFHIRRMKAWEMEGHG